MEKTPSVVVRAAPIDEEAGLEVHRPDVFNAYVMWKSVPSLLRYPPKGKNGLVPTPTEFATELGIDDEAVLELIELTTKLDFAAKYGVSDRTLSRWNKIIAKRDPMADIREWARPLNRNVMLSLYNKAIRGGLPEHYKLWLQTMAGWSERIRIDTRIIKTVQVEIVDAKEPTV